jgi:hypothetical protein
VAQVKVEGHARLTRKTASKPPAECDHSPYDAVCQYVSNNRYAKDQNRDCRFGARSSHEEHSRWPDVIPHSSKLRHALGIATQKNMLTDEQHERDDASKDQRRDDYSLHRDGVPSQLGALFTMVSGSQPRGTDTPPALSTSDTNRAQLRPYKL